MHSKPIEKLSESKLKKSVPDKDIHGPSQAIKPQIHVSLKSKIRFCIVFSSKIHFFPGIGIFFRIL